MPAPPFSAVSLFAQTANQNPLGNFLSDGTLVVAILSAIVGYCISLWRNRVLPWTTLIGFSEQVTNLDVVDIPEALSLASSRTWFIRPIQNTSDRLGNANQAPAFSQAFLKANESSRDAIQTTIERLRTAPTDSEKTSALYVSAGNAAVINLLEAAINRIAIVVDPPDPALGQVLQYQPVRSRADGCFGLDFPDELVLIGAGLNDDPIFANRLTPVLESMSRLDTNRLIPMFEQLLPLLQRQTELHRTVVELGEPIVQPKARWAAHINISNYGSAPFLLFPNKGWVLIECHDMDPFCLPTKLVYLDTNGRQQDVIGTYLVETGKTSTFMLLTTDTQSAIPRGDRLRALWKSGDGRAMARLHVRGRELPFALWGETSWVAFRNMNADSDE